jgi:hypothetical protein
VQVEFAECGHDFGAREAADVWHSHETVFGQAHKLVEEDDAVVDEGIMATRAETELVDPAPRERFAVCWRLRGCGRRPGDFCARCTLPLCAGRPIRGALVLVARVAAR